jgi:hypothetical protein
VIRQQAKKIYLKNINLLFISNPKSDDSPRDLYRRSQNHRTRAQ